jgi:5'(3')-deoxyribonucleotidase
MDDVLADYSSSFIHYQKTRSDIKYPQSIAGFFEKLEPIDGAIDAVHTLINNSSFDTYILTAPSTRNPLSYTEKRVWIENHFGYEFCEKLIICSNKGLLKGDILIDDNLTGKGQDKFEGEVLHFGSDEYPNWQVIQNTLYK